MRPPPQYVPTVEAEPAPPAVGHPARKLKEYGPALAVLVVVAAVSNLLMARFVAEERTLYGADHVAYWAMATGVAEGLAAHPLQTLGEVVESVATRELNLLPALPPALFMLVFGSSRTAYLLAVLNLYALPVLLLLAWLLRRLGGAAISPAYASWGALVATLLMPAFWWPISLGYLGVGGVLLAFAALYLYFDPQQAEGAALRFVTVGILLALMFLFRRWYAFWSVAFVVVCVVEGLWRGWRVRGSGAAARWRALRAAVLVAGSAALALAAAAGPLVWRVLHTDYADRFAFYKARLSWGAELGALLGHFGLVATAVTAASAVFLIRRADSRRPTLVLVLVAGLAALLFRRVQDPSPQHWYLLMPTFLLLAAWGAIGLATRSGSRRTQASWVAALSLVASLGFVATVVLPAGVAAPLAPDLRFAPQQREDLPEVVRLLAFLDRQLAERPGGVYVLGATPVLNHTALAHANLSLGTDFRTPRFLLNTAHVDLRDGFPVGLLAARYVVAAEPVQCRQPPAGQWVVAVPSAQILEGRGFGRAFTRLEGSFRFDDGVQAMVFERRQPLTAEDVAALSRGLQSHYPERPEVWRPPR